MKKIDGFRKVWAHVLSNADRDKVCYALIASFSGEEHVGIKNQAGLESSMNVEDLGLIVIRKLLYS